MRGDRRGRKALVAATFTLVLVVAAGVLAGRAIRPRVEREAAASKARVEATVTRATPWPTPSPVPASEEVAGADTAPEANAEVAGALGPAVPPLAIAPEVQDPAEADAAPVETAPIDAEPSPYPGLTRSGAPVWLAAQVGVPVKVDGLLDEWTTATVEVANVVFGSEHWDGPADLSSRAFFAYDTKNLYLAASVTDDVVSQPSSGDQLHLGDSLELQLDTDFAGDFQAQTYSADDWQIGLSPGDFQAAKPEAYVWRPEGVDAKAITVAARRTQFGYVLEAAIPWSMLDVDVRRTSRLGAAVNAGDDDLPEPAQLTLVSSVPARSWSDPRSFGTLILSTEER